MKFSKISSGVCVGLLTSSVALAEDAKKTAPAQPITAPSVSSATPEKSANPVKSPSDKNPSPAVYFEGCGKKDKGGKWIKFYANCETEVNGQEIPAPPCKKGWVTVSEAVPQNLISHLQKCTVEL